MKCTNPAGDRFDILRNNKRVTVLRGPSVVMDAFIYDDQLVVVRSEPTAPSKAAVLEGLGLREPPVKVQMHRDPSNADASDTKPETPSSKSREKRIALQKTKRKPLTVAVNGDDPNEPDAA